MSALLLSFAPACSSCTCEGKALRQSVPADDEGQGDEVQHDAADGPAMRQPFDEAIARACGQPTITAAGEQQFARFPYLQRVDQSSAELVWVGEADGLGLHLREPMTGAEQSVTAQIDDSAVPASGKQRFAHASNLQAGLLYCYELSDGDTLLASGGLRTAPEPDARVHFAAMGDVGRDTMRQRAVLAQLMAVDSELILFAGDLAYNDGTLEQFERYFFSVYRDYLASVPAFPASGNHDYVTDDASAFREVFRLFENGGPLGLERWYSFDWGPVHVAVLDTERFLPEQAVWLQSDLASTGRAWKVIMMHRPPFSSGHYGSDLLIQETFVPVFEAAGVDLVLAGHEHDYERTIDIGGVVYIITGGGGQGTRPVGSSSFTAYSAEVGHFVWIEAGPELLTVHAIDTSGVEFDTLRLAK